MSGNGKLKISIGAVVSLAVAVLVAILGIMWGRVASNAEEISDVKVQTKGNTTAIGFHGESLKRIEEGVTRLEHRFNTHPKKE
ncbi:MAG: hypothetical protein ACYTFI_00800 [Planctomycetota bacterium]|jgi:hypothetical protein